MQSRTGWRQDSIFIEFGVKDADVALSLREQGFDKYLGVSGNARRIAAIQEQHPELAGRLTCVSRRRLVRENNADVLILSGAWAAHVWKYRSVRRAQSVCWRLALSPFSVLAILGCLLHMLSGRYSWPRVVPLRTPGGKTRRMVVSRVLRQKVCHRPCLHFIPHGMGLQAVFQEFDRQHVRYVVLRWFESLPAMRPHEDVDLLIDDRSLDKALKILDSQPGVAPCDVYSESGLARSDYGGIPYYPARVARTILDGAVRHNELCMVPNSWDYFHSLAYHAAYHKGTRSNLYRGDTGLPARGKPSHDFAGILQEMADRLGIDVEISLQGLHAYLQENGWGPSAEELALMAAACGRNPWLRMLAQQLPQDIHDQGLTVFVLRREAVRRKLQDRILAMIQQGGFQILAVKTLSDEEVEHAAARVRGGNWGTGPFDISGGPPAVAVIAYDRDPQPLNRRQRRKFPERTNARIFVKEAIRDAIVSQMPSNQGCNALHSSDHAAEAWRLIEVLTPDLKDEIRARLREIRQDETDFGARRRAA